MTWWRSTLADLMGDMVVYRNLEPMDERIPGLLTSWKSVGLTHYYVPRKATPEYAAALLYFLRAAQAARGIAAPIERLLFIGDTLLNDGTVAKNLGKCLPMRGFIGADRLAEEPHVEIDGPLMVANRWTALGDFVAWSREADMVADERTALLIDLDKTSLGARGRNDRVIDGARVRAVQRTMQSALRDDFDGRAFRTLYDRLKQPAYHYFNADNQYNLSYICLMVSGEVCPAKEFWAALTSGALCSIEDFVARCERRRARMSPGLLQVQDEVRRGIAAQDPTPFKEFRRGEYLETVACMDVLDDDATAEAILAEEIVITAEVASVARHMAARGTLVFGISDKPDEASVPLPEDAVRGYRPIHRTVMKVYGEEVL